MDSSPGYRLVRLPNGARSIHSLVYAETFHPVIGPAAEAKALYVEQLGLVSRLAQHNGEFVVWDVGLGAAANPITLQRATAHLPSRLRLVSFDQTLEPLRFALAHAAELAYVGEYEPWLRQLLAAPGQALTFDRQQQSVTWELHLGDFPSFLTTSQAKELAKPHVILFDAYSPATNPAMWTQPLFASLFRLLEPNRPCVLPTYSRSTMLRVTLLLAGFFVGRGHATGEKEETTIAANTLDLLADPLDEQWLKRVRNSTSAEPLWQPVYRQAPISSESWENLRWHRQFHRPG
ncbi:MAG: MnmC family methyltransferase [Verrucomicrobiota bacterium]